MVALAFGTCQIGTCQIGLVVVTVALAFGLLLRSLLVALGKWQAPPSQAARPPPLGVTNRRLIGHRHRAADCARARRRAAGARFALRTGGVDHQL